MECVLPARGGFYSWAWDGGRAADVCTCGGLGRDARRRAFIPPPVRHQWWLTGAAAWQPCY